MVNQSETSFNFIIMITPKMDILILNLSPITQQRDSIEKNTLNKLMRVNLFIRLKHSSYLSYLSVIFQHQPPPRGELSEKIPEGGII